MENNENLSGVDFTKRPYAERRLIAVDRALQSIQVMSPQERSVLKQKAAEKSEGIGRKIFDFATDSIPVISLGKKAYKLGKKAYEVTMSDKSSSDFDGSVMLIGQKEADSLQFPPGHHQDNTVYVGHPLLAEVYYPLAEFHRFLFEHKVNEAINLLMSLGAKTMVVEHVDGWSREIAGNLSLPIPEAEMTASASASGKKKIESSILFRATLRGSDKPILPTDLLWYPHESTWRQLADGRIKFGLQEFSLVVSYISDFGVTANLAAKLAEMEFGIGGEFQKLTETKWKIEGVFA